jgi:hypothetical protein
MPTIPRKPRGVIIRRPDGSRPEPKEPTKPNKKTHYRIDAMCDNCEFEGRIWILKGIICVHGGLLGHEATCPDCGCVAIRRCLKDEEAKTPTPLTSTLDDDLRREMERIAREHTPLPIPIPAITPITPIPDYKTQPYERPQYEHKYTPPAHTWGGTDTYQYQMQSMQSQTDDGSVLVAMNVADSVPSGKRVSMAEAVGASHLVNLTNKLT